MKTMANSKCAPPQFIWRTLWIGSPIFFSRPLHLAEVPLESRCGGVVIQIARKITGIYRRHIALLVEVPRKAAAVRLPNVLNRRRGYSRSITATYARMQWFSLA